MSENFVLMSENLVLMSENLVLIRLIPTNILRNNIETNPSQYRKY